MCLEWGWEWDWWAMISDGWQEEFAFWYGFIREDGNAFIMGCDEYGKGR